MTELMVCSLMLDWKRTMEENIDVSGFHSLKLLIQQKAKEKNLKKRFPTDNSMDGKRATFLKNVKVKSCN